MKPLLKNTIAVITLLLSIHIIAYSQDTTKPKTTPVTKEDTSYVQNFIMADHNYQYINKISPDTLTRSRFLWYPTKSLEDIFNYVPGYYQYFMDVGQLNPVSFNQFSYSQTGVLRNGRPVNDLFDGNPDLNLFSRNEISELEFSGGYRNNNYSFANTINAIQRELFQFRPYTEISFYQDRYENLYFDGNFHQNLFRKLHFNFGITKHSYDGHYDNSAFDKWLGRFNLWFAPSAKLNTYLKVNYSIINRELNEGIDPDTVNLGSKDIFNTSLAAVVYAGQHDRRERFDVDLGAIFLAGKISTSKIQFYVSNSFREYFQISDLNNPDSPESQDNYHWINYGVKISQQFRLNLNKNLLLITNSEGDFNKYIYQISRQSTSSSVNYREDEVKGIQEAALKYDNLTLKGYIKAKTSALDYYEYGLFRYIYLTAGTEAQYSLYMQDSSLFGFSGIYNYTDGYLSGSVNYKNRSFNAGGEFYYCRTDTYPYLYSSLKLSSDVVFRGVNSFADIKIFKFKFSGNYNYSFRNSENLYTPEHSGRLNLHFEDNAFKNKLEYKIGLTTRFWSKYSALFYSGSTNSLKASDYEVEILKIPANATLDFYIMARIGKATFGLTFENILDRIIYNTGVYPFMDRGGFLNSMSRFNITWNFFD